MKVAPGLCECGCGGETPLAPYSHAKIGWKRGQPIRFIRGHQLGGGAANPNWKGGRVEHKNHYVMVHSPDHAHANEHGYVYEHVLVASTALGRPLPSGVEVHHVDGDKWNNRGSNLVVCQDKAYHRLLERRTRALQACGNANWRRCRFCGEWAPVEDLYVSPNGRCVHHRQCDAAYARDRKLVSA